MGYCSVSAPGSPGRPFPSAPPDWRPKLTPLKETGVVGSARPGEAGRGCAAGPSAGWRGGSGAVLEAPAFVAGLGDVAVVSEAVEQRGRHLWIAEHARPFAEGEVGRDDDRGALIETADEMEQQLPAGLGEGEIAEFVEDDEVEAREIIGEPSLAASARLSLELIDEIDGGEEAPAQSGSDAASRDGDGQMRLARSGSPDQDDVALLGDEAAGGEVAHESLVDRRVLEREVVDVLGQRQLGDGELVLDRARLLLRDLGPQEIADKALRLVLAFERRG